MAKWIDDPQNRDEVEKVTEELKLPIWHAWYKGKFRDFWNECWAKIEDGYLRLNNEKVNKSGDKMTGNLEMGTEKVFIGSYNYGYMLRDKDGTSVYLAYYGDNKKINIGYGNDIPVNFFNDKVTIKNNKIWHAGNFDPKDYEPKFEKNTGFNLDKTDSYKEDSTSKLATAKGLYGLWQWITKTLVTVTNSIQRAYDRGTEALNEANKKLDLTGGTVSGTLKVKSSLQAHQLFLNKNFFIEDYYGGANKAQFWFNGDVDKVYDENTLYLDGVKNLKISKENVLTVGNSGFTKEILFEGVLARTNTVLSKSLSSFDIIVINFGDNRLNIALSSSNKGDMCTTWYLPEDIIGNRIQGMYVDTDGSKDEESELDVNYIDVLDKNTIKFAYHYGLKNNYDINISRVFCRIVGLKYEFGGK